MLFLNKKITITLLVLIAILLAFIMGVAFSAKYLLIREMQQREEILIRNLTALADCKINRCSKTRQQLLIVENDAAFKEFALLEIDSENVWYLNFSRAATLFVLSL